MVLFESKIRYEKAPVRSPKINSMKIDCFFKIRLSGGYGFRDYH